MHVDISSLAKEREGASICFSISDDGKELDCEPRVARFLAPIVLEGTVTRDARGFLVDASIQTEVLAACDRCLVPVQVPLYCKFSALFREETAADGKEADHGEEEIETFSKDMLDLKNVVQRNILFSLPMKVLCREDCRGLCPVCGKDLNEGDCGCEETYINPKFESLRSLFHVDEEV